MKKQNFFLITAFLLAGLCSGCGGSKDTDVPVSEPGQAKSALPFSRQDTTEELSKNSAKDPSQNLMEILFPEAPARLGMAAKDYPGEISEPFTFADGTQYRYLFVDTGIAASMAELFFLEDGGLSYVEIYGTELTPDELTELCGEPAFSIETDTDSTFYWLSEKELYLCSTAENRLALYTIAGAEQFCPDCLLTAKTGLLLSSAGFDDLYWYQESPSGSFGLYDAAGNTRLTEACYEECGAFDDTGMAPVQKDGYWGYLNASGETVIGHYFENAESFCGDRAVVGTTGSWGAIDRIGSYVVQPEYRTVSIENNYIIVKNEANNYGVFDSGGNELIKASTNIKDEDYESIVIHNGLLYAKTSERWYHVFDENGNALVGNGPLSEAKSVSLPKNGFHIVRLSGNRYTFADECLYPIGNNFYNELTDFSASGYAIGCIDWITWDVIDTQGNVVHTLPELNNGDGNTTYDYANSFLVCGSYAVGMGQNSVKYGILDLQTGEFTEYAEVNPRDGIECIVVTAKSGKQGMYVNRDLLFECVYDKISFDGSQFELKRGNEVSIYCPE